MHGQPRFVLGVYDSGGSYSSDPAFWEKQIFSPTGPRGLAGFPLNLYLNYWLGNMPIGPTNALLDVLHSHGMMYLQTGNCFEAGSWKRQPFSIANQAYVEQFAQHPAAAGYYIMDECADALIGETQQHHQQLKAWDPQGISFAATLAAGYRDPSLWTDAADLLGTDPYPLYGAESAHGYTHFIVADHTAQLRSVARPDRPIWAVLQFFKFTSNSRMPSEAELRSHAVMAIVEGAQGIFWWDIGVNGLRKLDSGTVSTYMGYLRTLTTELAGLEAALVAPASGALIGNSTAFADPVAGRIGQLQRNIQVEWLYSRKQWYQAELDALRAGNHSKSPLLQGAANVRTLTKVVNGVGYVFAYNYTNQPMPVTFTWHSALAGVRESRSGRAFPVSGATWTDTFGPYEARIYVVNDNGEPAPPPAPTPAPGLAVSFTNPGNGATVSGNTTVTAAASGGSGSGYSFAVAADGTTVYAGTNPTFSWNTTTVADGSRSLTATVTDSAGATATATRTVTVKNTAAPPAPSPAPGAPAGFAASFSYPAPAAAVSGMQTVGMATTAPWGQAKTFTLSVDGQVVTTQNTTGTTLWHMWDTTGVANGSRTLTFAVSMNGQTATTTLPVTVNNAGSTVPPPPSSAPAPPAPAPAPPTSEPPAPTPASFTTAFAYPASDVIVSGNQTVGVSTTAAWGQAKTFTLSVDGTVITTQNLTGTTLWHTWDTSKIGNGSRALTVTVTMNGQTATTTLPVIISNGSWMLGLRARQSTFKTGDVVPLDVTVRNPGASLKADVYFGITLPPAAGPALGCAGGDAVAFFVESSPEAIIRCASASPATFPAYAAGAAIPAALAPTVVGTSISAQWAQAAGPYTVFIAFVAPGSLARGSMQPGDIIAIASQTLTGAP